MKGNEVSYNEANNFLLHKTLESKTGNQYSNGILYLILCELLDIPVKAVALPQQLVLAYFRHGYSDDNLTEPLEKIEFFIDPSSGQMFTYENVENYFKRISLTPSKSYFKPQSNKAVIRMLLDEYCKCFTSEKDRYKQKELQELAEMIG